jgi:hypothetical protein
LRIRYSGSGVLAAAVAEGLVLDAATDLVDAAVADAHDVERVSDAAGVIEVWGQPSAERLGQVGGHHLDPRQPGRIRVGRPSPQVPGRVAFDHVDHDVSSRSIRPVAYTVACDGVAARNDVSSTPR